MWALKDIIQILNQGTDVRIVELRAYLGADQP